MNIKNSTAGRLARLKSQLLRPRLARRMRHPQRLAMTSEQAEQVIALNYSPPVRFAIADPLPAADPAMTLSVIIPVWNDETYLEACLDSILGQQTHHAFEVICIDDGSTDGTAAILDRYAADRGVIARRQDNQGIAAARNAGLALAHGRYVLFVDHDDTLAPGFIETMLAAAGEHGASIVKCGARFFRDDRPGRDELLVESDRVVVHGELGERLLVYRGFCWGTLFDRTVFDRVRFPTRFWYEDMITRLLLLRLGQVFVYLPDVLYNHRIHAANASNTVWSDRRFKALDQLFLARDIVACADALELTPDPWAYRLLLSECSEFLFARIARLDLDTRRAAFVLAAELVEGYRARLPQLGPLAFREQALASSLAARDFGLWEMACRFR